MKKTVLKSLILIVSITFASCSAIKVNEDIVKSFIDARNNYDVAKVNTFIDKNYQETFIDGSIEIENPAQLKNIILWGKELNSHIKVIDIKSDGNKVVTIEENTNYLDVALKRKARKFKIVYHFFNKKIQKQKIDTLAGYSQISRFNSDRFMEFVKYCEQNNLNYNYPFNQENGKQLRKVLERYKNLNE